MIIGALILKMNGDPYYETPIAAQTTAGLFSVQVSNVAGPGTVTVTIVIQHRNRDDVAWSTAGTFSPITGPDVYSLEVTGLKELVRYSYTIAGASTDATSGAHVFAATPQWLVD